MTTVQPSSHSILIVEDEEAHAELVRRVIRKAGFGSRIDVACDGEEALNYLGRVGDFEDENRPPMPGLILLDIKLPGVGGLEVLERIKAHPALNKIPVVMLTTSDRKEDVAESYRLKANCYLTKPLGVKEFEETMEQVGLHGFHQ